MQMIFILSYDDLLLSLSVLFLGPSPLPPGLSPQYLPPQPFSYVDKLIFFHFVDRFPLAILNQCVTLGVNINTTTKPLVVQMYHLPLIFLFCCCCVIHYDEQNNNGLLVKTLLLTIFTMNCSDLFTPAIRLYCRTTSYHFNNKAKMSEVQLNILMVQFMPLDVSKA